MEKEKLINFETAKLAKEKGFPQTFQFEYWVYFVEEQPEKVELYPSHVKFSISVEKYAAPTQSFLQKWVREEKKLEIIPPINYFNLGYSCTPFKPLNNKYFQTYEEALENELQIALKQC